MKKTTIIGLLVAVIVFSEIVTPFAASWWLDSSLNKVMPARQHSVSARSLPGFALWLGRFDKVRAVSEDAQIDGLKIRESRVTIDDARIDVAELIGNNRINIKLVRNLEVMMKLNEKDLADYLAIKVKEVKNPTVKILADKIEVRGDIDLGLIKLAVAVDGRIVGDGQSIRFRSDRLEVKNAGGINFAGLFAEIPLLDLTQLPFKVGVRKIFTEPGVVIIHADNR